MGGYGELKLGATLRSADLSVTLYVDNALNRRGDTLAFGNPFSFNSIEQTTPQQPRTIGLRASRRF
jgi:outer membrane receptor protein involved in Fe transport